MAKLTNRGMIGKLIDEKSNAIVKPRPLTKKKLAIAEERIVEWYREYQRENICASEEISVELSVLRALCRKTNNDIRSCINTLQFLSCSDCAIQHGDVERVTFGLKDSKKSLFDVWADVFRLPRLKRLHDCAGPTSENRYIDARCETVLTAVARCEQEDRLFDGLFENYPLIQFKDRHLRAIRSGLCWIEFMDHLNRWINENQLFELLAYRRYVAVAFHLLFASGNFAKLNYPQQQKDVTIRIDRNAAMLQSLLSDLSTEIRSAIDRSDLITDVLPFLLQIVQPEIKSSNPQLYTPREWSAFRNAARVMAQYNITYRQQRSADGSFQAVMEPPLEDVALFAVDMPFRPTLSYNARQAIAREAQLTRLSAIGDHTARKGEAPPPPPSKSKTANKEASANRAEAPRSFLARRTARRSVPLPFAIEFKFQSGSDCVIRRRIRVRDLL